jgi:hypothetical protein
MDMKDLERSYVSQEKFEPTISYFLVELQEFS